MFLVKSFSVNPYFNLAMEEYFMRNYKDDFFLLWKNKPTVVLGKHQNVYEEVNLDYVRANKILIARRISGGGTVFHDENNINFTFIKKGRVADFHEFTLPIVSALKHLGIDVILKGKNDLCVGNNKISGNAAYLFNDKVLHHGTLLFKSNLKHLKNAIKKEDKRYSSKSVKSNHSEVANIFDFIEGKIDTEFFFQHIFNSVKEVFFQSKEFFLKDRDKENIIRMMNEKFLKWKWIFGYAPRYYFENKFVASGKHFNVAITTCDACLVNIRILINGTQIKMDSEIFRGVKHDPIFLKKTILNNKEKLSLLLNHLSIDKLVSCLY